MRLTVRRISNPSFKEANNIDDFKAVCSSLDISRSLVFYLSMSDYEKYGNSAKVVHALNDILQGRSDHTVDELIAGVDTICGGVEDYVGDRAMLLQRIKDFQHQKELLGQPYTKSSSKTFGFCENGTKPVINQQLYDQAAKEGFPLGFFRQSHFDRVTFYCIPDHTDFNFSYFSNCTFAVCRIREATFDGASIYSSEFHSCAMQYVTFFKASIAHTHFHDSTLRNVSFQRAHLKSCNTVDCGLEGVGFLNATLDGCFFGRVAARGISSLHTATITQGGATENEVNHNREAIFAALRPDKGERRETTVKERGKR